MTTTVRPERAGPPDGFGAAQRGKAEPGQAPDRQRGIRRYWRRRRAARAGSRSQHLRSRRRRLLLASMPVIVLLALVATRLVTLNLVHHQTLAAYQAGDQSATRVWAERQGWVNVVEPFRSPFAIGDAAVLGGRFEAARPWFEQAFEQVPKGGLDDCKVRVNLGLTYEALGDAAKARERTAEWKQFYDKGLTITRERPPLCDAPEGKKTGESLQQTQQRLESKNKDSEADSPPPPSPPPPSDPPKPPSSDPTPGPQQPPSEQRQEQLKQQQQRNTTDRNRQTDEQGREQTGGDDGPSVAKPW